MKENPYGVREEALWDENMLLKDNPYGIFYAVGVFSQ